MLSAGGLRAAAVGAGAGSSCRGGAEASGAAAGGGRASCGRDLAQALWAAGAAVGARARVDALQPRTGSRTGLPAAVARGVLEYGSQMTLMLAVMLAVISNDATGRRGPPRPLS